MQDENKMLIDGIEAEWQLFLKFIDSWHDGITNLNELKSAYYQSVARLLRIKTKYVN